MINTILLLTILIINVVYLYRIYNVIQDNTHFINTLQNYNKFLLQKIIELEEDEDYYEM